MARWLVLVLVCGCSGSVSSVLDAASAPRSSVRPPRATSLDADVMADAVVRADVAAIDGDPTMPDVAATPETAADAPCLPLAQAEACGGGGCGSAPNGCGGMLSCVPDGGNVQCPMGQWCGAFVANACGGCVAADAGDGVGVTPLGKLCASERSGSVPYLSCPLTGPALPAQGCVWVARDDAGVACCGG